MSTRAVKETHAHFVSVELDITAPDVLSIGAQMQKIDAEAVMNGYNWSAFIDRYLAMKFPEMLDGLERDPEAGHYLALYENNDLGNKKADILVKILNYFIAKPQDVYAFMQEESDGVEWI
jgi:hypothetical protein